MAQEETMGGILKLCLPVPQPAGQWPHRGPAHILRPKYTWTKIPQMVNSGSLVMKSERERKKIQIKDKVENV